MDAKLDALDNRIALIKDLSASFEQQKKSSMLRKPMTSSGVIRLKGDKTRWDTLRPHATTMTIDTSEVRIYYPEQKTVEVYPVQGEMARLASSPIPRMALVREQFTIEEVKPADIDPTAKGDLLGIKLTPRSESLKEHLRHVRVLIDSSTACARVVEMVDPDGETTRITFSDVKLDQVLKDEDVTFAAPAGTTVSRPLEGGAPKPQEAPAAKDGPKK
jgi:outer membrane lipoprotein-sorting protein